MLVDVDGYAVSASVVNGSGPAVVFISGRGDGGDVWAPVLSLLDTGSATLTYDRAGIGGSGVRPTGGPWPYSALARELVLLLQGVRLAGPFVIVAHSMGALIARSFAAAEPHLVAGLVLVDGSVNEVALWPNDRPPTDGPGAGATLLDFKGGAAELAVALDPVVPGVVLTRTPGRWPDPQATTEVDQRWTRHQEDMAERLNAPLLVANDSGHYVHRDAAALTALAVCELLRTITAGRSMVIFDNARVAAAGGRLALSHQ